MRQHTKATLGCRFITLALVTLMTLANGTIYAQSTEDLHKEYSTFWDDLRSNHIVQVGVDTWNLKKNLGQPGIVDSTRALNLADSQPHGDYKSTSPWVKVDAEARRRNAIFRFRFDQNQSVGSRIDELSADFSHFDFGIRAGVLGYKVSWCRTQDVDSPWMRENDPFCIVHTTSAAIKSAPGIQAYVNTLMGSYKVQSLVGVYRPLFGNFNTTEFGEDVSPNLRVIGNNKYGASVNAIDLNSGTELRLSYLNSDQMANKIVPTDPTRRVDQTSEVTYAAISTYITPLINLRLSHFKSKAHVDHKFPAGYAKPGDYYPDLFDIFDRKRNSKVLELNYQHTNRDVISYAYSRYDVSDSYQSIRQLIYSEKLHYYAPVNIKFNNTSHSIAWRRDWQKGIFTIVQATFADLTHPLTAETTTLYSHSTGRALGLRLGYSF